LEGTKRQQISWNPCRMGKSKMLGVEQLLRISAFSVYTSNCERCYF
jgi:hypothetical protein